MGNKERQLTLTVVRGSDPIEGRIRVEDDAAVSFCGYMQLVALLEQVRTEASGTGPGSQDDH